MSVLQSIYTRSLTQASTSTSQGLDELNRIAVGQALAPQQQLFSETEPADYLLRVSDGVLKAYRLLPDGRCELSGLFFPGDLLGIESSGIISRRTKGKVQILDREALSRTRKGFGPRTRHNPGEYTNYGLSNSGSHKAVNAFKHVNLRHKERLYEPLGRRQGTPGSLGASQIGG